MPEGVEHEAFVASLRILLVPLAVMPEGVEHRRPRCWTSSAPGRVPLAVMPEGVEHYETMVSHSVSVLSRSP